MPSFIEYSVDGVCPSNPEISCHGVCIYDGSITHGFCGDLMDAILCSGHLYVIWLYTLVGTLPTLIFSILRHTLTNYKISSMKIVVEVLQSFFIGCIIQSLICSFYVSLVLISIAPIGLFFCVLFQFMTICFNYGREEDKGQFGYVYKLMRIKPIPRSYFENRLSFFRSISPSIQICPTLNPPPYYDCPCCLSEDKKDIEERLATIHRDIPFVTWEDATTLPRIPKDRVCVITFTNETIFTPGIARRIQEEAVEVAREAYAIDTDVTVEVCQEIAGFKQQMVIEKVHGCSFQSFTSSFIFPFFYFLLSLFGQTTIIESIWALCVPKIHIFIKKKVSELDIYANRGGEHVRSGIYLDTEIQIDDRHGEFISSLTGPSATDMLDYYNPNAFVDRFQ